MNSNLMLSSWGRRLGKSFMRGNKKFKPEVEADRSWKIVRGDNVEVINGPQTGQKGKVLQVLRQANRILVQDVNMRMRAIKPGMDGTPGKKILKPCTIHYSNVMLIDPSTGLPTKVATRFLEDGSKVRVSKKSGHIIPKPDPLADRKVRSIVVGPKDTEPADVHDVTFADYEKYLPYIYKSLRN